MSYICVFCLLLSNRVEYYKYVTFEILYDLEFFLYIALIHLFQFEMKLYELFFKKYVIIFKNNKVDLKRDFLISNSMKTS